MDHDQWGALVLFVIAAIMMLASIIDRARKNKIRRNQR